MIRRAFCRAFSGAVFATMLGVKVETWKLEDDGFGIGGFDSESTIGTIHVRVPNTPPGDVPLGAMWWNTDTASLWSFNGESWTAVP